MRAETMPCAGHDIKGPPRVLRHHAQGCGSGTNERPGAAGFARAQQMRRRALVRTCHTPVSCRNLEGWRSFDIRVVRASDRMSPPCDDKHREECGGGLEADAVAHDARWNVYVPGVTMPGACRVYIRLTGWAQRGRQL